MSYTNAECHQIASTILQQLGGKRFDVMTGCGSYASGMFGEKPGLSMRFPNTKNKLKARGLIITLNGNDLYDLEFLAMKKYEVVSLKTVEDIFCENLREVFEAETGLYTSL